MTKEEVIKKLLSKKNSQPQKAYAQAFAHSNIALVKYWGKRDLQLNLPVTASLSISLGDKGTTTEIKISQKRAFFLNQKPLSPDSSFYKRLETFINLFSIEKSSAFEIHSFSNIPIAAGLASSASGFAALVKVLNQFFAWGLAENELSILARLGSGSACRSIQRGFVQWHQGVRKDGMDSYGEALASSWPELGIGLFILSHQEKILSSREAMQRTVASSLFYSTWPKQVYRDLISLKKAIQEHDFYLLGQIAESNALAMHALMLTARPAISYSLPQTWEAIQKIWHLRKEGLPLYFTQDAGPNLKLLFLRKDLEAIQTYFPSLEVIFPFA